MLGIWVLLTLTHKGQGMYACLVLRRAVHLLPESLATMLLIFATLLVSGLS